MTRFEELVGKLSELFELDKVDLDFGIHRIIKTKHEQISEYLGGRLPQKVKTVLGELARAETEEALSDHRRQVVGAFGEGALY